MTKCIPSQQFCCDKETDTKFKFKKKTAAEQNITFSALRRLYFIEERLIYTIWAI